MADASKADKVREYMAKHPDATPQEVAKALTAPGVEISARYISQIKARGGATKAKKVKPRVTSKKTRVKKTGAKPTVRRGRSPRPYPAKTLEETLAIPGQYASKTTAIRGTQKTSRKRHWVWQEATTNFSTRRRQPAIMG